MKNIIVFGFIIAHLSLFGQKEFTVAVNFLDKPSDVQFNINYNNWFKYIPFDAVNKESKNILIKGAYYYNFTIINIYFSHSVGSYTFMLKGNRGTIDFDFTNHRIVPVIKTEGLILLDTASSKNMQELANFSLNHRLKLSKFLNSPSNMDSLSKSKFSDSLSTLYKLMTEKDLEYLRSISDIDFSFYYFRDCIVAMANNFSVLFQDKKLFEYLKDQYHLLFTSSFIKNAGKEMERALSQSEIYSGSAAPVFSFEDISGKNFSSNSFVGKFVLLDFWATWCSPCIEEIPTVRKIYDTVGESKLKIIGISLDYDEETLCKGLKKYNIDWTQFLDEKNYMTNKFGVYAIPVIILIGPDGKILYNSSKQKDENMLSTLLRMIK